MTPQRHHPPEPLIEARPLAPFRSRIAGLVGVRPLGIPRVGILLPLLLALPLLVEALWPEDALARPGGGHSYSGGGGGSSSGGGGYGGGGGGGDGANLIFFLIRLCITYPAIGVPVTIGVIVFVLWQKHQGGGAPSWVAGHVSHDASAPPPRVRAQAPSGESARATLVRARALDPDFSVVLFEDFVYALYAKVHTARGSGDLETLSTYLAEDPRRTLGALSQGLSAVETPVIGALHYVAAQVPEGPGAQGKIRCVFDVESNYTEVRGEGTDARRQTFYAVERWYLSRAPAARSRPPAEIQTIGCPSCGGPLSSMRAEVCGYCGARVEPGELDWVVYKINTLERQTRGPQLTGHVEEVGTDLPTLRAPDAQARFDALLREDGALTQDQLEARIGRIFASTSEAWTTLSWSEARPYVSDSLFQTYLYWIEAYQQEGLRNIHGDGKIEAIHLARVERDRYFDAVTMRVYASSLDWTVDTQGRVVGGDPTRRRRYSEYWTLIRGRGASGAARADDSCPSCGAPNKVNMAGHCTYCSAKLTSGAFDWVLSRVEQDESFRL